MAKPHLRLVQALPRSLPVLSVYYIGKDVVKNNRSGNPLRACGQALQYMRTNKYEATHVEVYDEDNGTLYAVLTRNVNGVVRVVFEFDFDAKTGV